MKRRKQKMENKNRYDLKRFIKVKSGKVVDTTLLLPHTECYFVKGDELYMESTDGTSLYLGKVIVETNNLGDLA